MSVNSIYSDKTFLENPRDIAISATRWSYVWKVAAVVTAVALASLLALAMTAIAIATAPLSLSDVIIMGAITILIAVQTKSIFDHMWNIAHSYENKALQGCFEADFLDSLNQNETFEKVKNQFNIQRNDTPLLKRCLAHLLALEATVEKTEKLYKSLEKYSANSTEEVAISIDGKDVLIKPSDFSCTNFNKDSLPFHQKVMEALYQLRLPALHYSSKLIEFKMASVQMLSILRRNEKIEAVTSLPKNITNVGQLAVHKFFDDTTTTNCIITKNKTIKLEQAIKMSVEELYTELTQ